MRSAWHCLKKRDVDAMADYLFGSAVLCTKEKNLITAEQFRQLIASGNTAEAYRLLEAFGVTLYRDPVSGEVQREATLSARLRDAYLAADEAAPGSEALVLWRYPYDCNNLKAAIKCFARRVSPASMLFDFGTVPADRIVEMVARADYRGLPRNMREAAPKATEVLSKTNDPQAVDLILDRAVYLDMCEAASRAGIPFVDRILKAKIDLTNIITVLRSIRLREAGRGDAVPTEAYLPGGAWSEDTCERLAQEGIAALGEALIGTPYDAFSRLLSETVTLREIEHAADDHIAQLCAEVKYMPIGPEQMVVYLLRSETEIKNLRILLVGLGMGLDGERIRERFRSNEI